VFSEDHLATVCANYMRMMGMTTAQKDLLAQAFPFISSNPLLEKLLQNVQNAYNKLDKVNEDAAKRQFLLCVQQSALFGFVVCLLL
jgi:hypothetical protein